MQDLRPLGRRRRGHELANQIEAAQLGHQVVDDEHVERSARAEQPLRLARARRGHHLVAFVAQRLRQRVADLRFVVDEQNRAVVAVMRLVA